ncbi:MAG: hypothetical protein HN564_08190, partial [Flavobacteriales bacterium]|nr:hypothetical protein [Flavobacteriales bacterium]
MKKLLLIILCLPINYCSCEGEKKENDLTKYNIKGKVNEITETKYNAKESFGDFQKTDL